MTLAASQNGNPFPGLRSFEREQAHLFFGREQQIKDLIARLRVHRFLPIVGVSGSGKSSLVRAGLIPTLTGSYVGNDTSGWRIALFRPGRGPMQELAETLCREFSVPDPDAMLQVLRSSTAGLARVAQQHLGEGEKLLVLVDQFEELFRYGDKADAAGETNEAAAFVKLLLAATGQSEHPLPGFDNLPVFVVTTMRSDFLGKCSRFRGLPEALNQSQYLIPRLTREEQRDAIEGPVGMANGSIAPALVQRLLNDLGDNPDQLPALQHALMRTWEQSAAAREMTVADYEAIGGMDKALNRDAERVYESLVDDEDKTVARKIFQRLVQPGSPDSETRSPTPLSELVAVTAADEKDLRRIIEIFLKRGFLTVSSDDDPIIDIPHESLIRGWERLTTWVQDEFRSAAIYRRLVDTAVLHSQIGVWLVDPELQLTLNWYQEAKPNPAWAARYDSRFTEAIEFLKKSQDEQKASLERAEEKRRRELNRTRLVATVLGILLLAAIGSLVFAYIQWRRTLREQDRGRHLIYASNLYFASSAVAVNQFSQARNRLDELLARDLKGLRGVEWFYLWLAAHADEATLSGHAGSVRSVAISPDGTLLASGGDDRTVRLWDVAQRKQVGRFDGHSTAVKAVAFSPDGKTLASAGPDSTVRLWNVAAREGLQIFRAHLHGVNAVAFSPDGKILASGSNDGIVKLWDVSGRQELFTLSGHSEVIRSLAFSPDGKILASGGDETVKLWDIATRKIVGSFPSSAWSVAFSPVGNTIVFPVGTTVKLRDIGTRKEVDLKKQIDDFVRAELAAISPDGNTLAAAYDNRTIRLWNITKREIVGTLAGHSGDITSLAFLPDGKTLVSASKDNTVKLWDVANRKDATILSGHVDAVTSIAFAPDGKMLASASAGGDIRLWDTEKRVEADRLSYTDSKVNSVAFSPDGRTLAYASDDQTVGLWDIAGKNVNTLEHESRVKSVAFSRDKILASGTGYGRLTLWNTAGGDKLLSVAAHDGEISALAFSPDGKTLASAGDDGKVKLWDVASQKQVVTLEGHLNSVEALAFSPDGKTLASAGYGNTIILWDVAARTQLGLLYGHYGYISSLAFSPDGKTLASASNDQTVKLWDIGERKEVTTLSIPYPNAIAFSQNGRKLAAGSEDNTVKLWFAATDEEVEDRRKRDQATASSAGPKQNQ
jgi:WD40 repeat protein